MRLLPFLIGIALLLYVGEQYGMMFAEQRRLAQEWERQKSAPLTVLQSRAATSQDQLTRLQIPKINLDAVIVEGTRHRQLAVAPGHMTDTPAPGEAGNAVITGHRDTFFRHIYELQRGDSIVVQRDGKTFNFEVTGKQIVQPDDLSVIRPSDDSRLTLITCYPTYYIGPAPERLVVFSKLKLQDGAASSATNNSGTVKSSAATSGSIN
ncbi:MAG TPA: class D sortase [Terriglobales bacterium]|nr:class D sortase [Terriglobales bacterium]